MICSKVTFSDTDFILQDHLGSTVGTAEDDGDLASTIKYFPWGDCRNSTGTIPTDRKFTGQRLDTTGLYYYNARYYDPEIGRFISPDTIIPDPANPQSFNRYSYCLNNPLKYVDPSGHVVEWGIPQIDWSNPVLFSQWAVEFTALTNAWSNLCYAEPVATNYLINSQETITMVMDYKQKGGGFCDRVGDNGNIIISLYTDRMFGLDLTALLGHEVFHAVIGNKAYLAGIADWDLKMNSQANEILAFAFEHRIGVEIGLAWDPTVSEHQYPILCQNANPNNLDTAMVTDISKQFHEYYKSLQPWLNYDHYHKTDYWSCTGPRPNWELNQQQFLNDAASIWYDQILSAGGLI